MTLLNIIGVAFLGAVVITGVVLKLYMKKKLEDIDGLGAIHKKENEDDTVIFF